MSGNGSITVSGGAACVGKSGAGGRAGWAAKGVARGVGKEGGGRVTRAPCRICCCACGASQRRWRSATAPRPEVTAAPPAEEASCALFCVCTVLSRISAAAKEETTDRYRQHGARSVRWGGAPHANEIILLKEMPHIELIEVVPPPLREKRSEGRRERRGGGKQYGQRRRDRWIATLRPKADTIRRRCGQVCRALRAPVLHQGEPQPRASAQRPAWS